MQFTKSLSELNLEQREAVESRTPTLVIAGPGSGKTKMLATKAAMLLSEGDTRVGAVTFSKESAIELQHRIKLMSDPSHHKRLLVGTFHGLSYKLLTRKLAIASDGQKKLHIINALAQCEIVMNARDAMMLIDKIKATGVHPSKSSDEGRLFFAYQKMLELNSQMDFSDLLTHSVTGLEDGTIYPYPLDHLLVDEFQDTDPIQYRWMMAHQRSGAIPTVVGDDDQSIYAFRSAMGYSGMQRFLLESNAREIVLTQNYRCRGEILRAALNCVRHNQDRIHKELQAFRGSGGFVSSKVFLDAETEAEFIVDQIGDYKKGSHAVLSRNNDDFDIVESILRASNIPYYRPNDSSLFDTQEVAMYFGLIELIAGLTKNVGIDIIYRTIQISEHDRDVLHSMKIVGFEKIGRSELINAGCSEDAATLYRSFATHFAEWKSLCQRDRLTLMINGVAEWLIDKLPEKQKHSKNILMAAKMALERLQGDIASRLRFLKENKNNEPEEHAVRLLTLHSSKGLEFDEVYIIRSESSICPSDKSPIDEERRLFYVGITRAKDRLYVTSTAKNKPSLFVAEMAG